MITRDDIRTVLERVRDKLGFERAVQVVHEIGGASHLIYVDQNRFELMHQHALVLLAHIEIADGLLRAASELITAHDALTTAESEMSDARKALATAVAAAVTEMGKAADFIKAHPAAQDDTDLMDMANRLSAAATALSGVDTEPQPVDTGTGAVDTGGTDIGSGTVSG
jgi:hypothetical protein